MAFTTVTVLSLIISHVVEPISATTYVEETVTFLPNDWQIGLYLFCQFVKSLSITASDWITIFMGATFVPRGDTLLILLTPFYISCVSVFWLWYGSGDEVELQPQDDDLCDVCSAKPGHVLPCCGLDPADELRENHKKICYDCYLKNRDRALAAVPPAPPTCPYCRDIVHPIWVNPVEALAYFGQRPSGTGAVRLAKEFSSKLLTNAENRKLVVEFETYPLSYKAQRDEVARNFVSTFESGVAGYVLLNRVRALNTRRYVKLPKGLVAEMQEFWLGIDNPDVDKFRTAAAIVSHKLNMVANMTPVERAEAVIFGPRVSFEFWKDRREAVISDVQDWASNYWLQWVCLLGLAYLVTCQLGQVVTDYIAMFDVVTYRGYWQQYWSVINIDVRHMSWLTMARAFSSNIRVHVTNGIKLLWNVGFGEIPYYYVDCSSWYGLTSFFTKIPFVKCLHELQRAIAVARGLAAVEGILSIFTAVAVFYRDRTMMLSLLLEECIRWLLLTNGLTYYHVAVFVTIGLFEVVASCRQRGILSVCHLIGHIGLLWVSRHPLVLLSYHCCWNYTFPTMPLNIIRALHTAFWYTPKPPRTDIGAYVHVPDITELPKPKGYQVLYGYGVKDYVPLAFESNRVNEEAAVNARIVCGGLPDTPARVAAQEAYVQWADKNIDKLLPRIGKVEPLPFNVYLKQSNAKPGVKKKLARVRAELESQGINEYTVLTSEQIRRWTTREAFVKVENNNYRTPAGLKKKAPRLIQGAPAEFIVLVGPWIAALQKRIKKRWSKNNHLCFTSGVSMKDAAHLATCGVDGWRIIEDDVSEWDASVSEKLTKAEVKWCKKWGCPTATYALIKANANTRGATSTGIRYGRKGMRKSGDPYTSLKNTLQNGLTHVFALQHDLDWDGDHDNMALFRQVYELSFLLTYIRMILQGDDNYMRIAHFIKTVEKMSTIMDLLGFASKIIERSTVEESEFCNNIMYKTDQGYCFGPKPGRVMAKVGWFINPPNVSRRGLTKGLALGLMPMCTHISVLRVYLESILYHTRNEKAVWVNVQEDWRMKGVGLPESPSCFVTLYERYHISPALVDSFRDYLFSKDRLGTFIDHPLVLLLADRDTNGPALWF